MSESVCPCTGRHEQDGWAREADDDCDCNRACHIYFCYPFFGSYYEEIAEEFPDEQMWACLYWPTMFGMLGGFILPAVAQVCWYGVMFYLSCSLYPRLHRKMGVQPRICCGCEWFFNFCCLMGPCCWCFLPQIQKQLEHRARNGEAGRDGAASAADEEEPQAGGVAAAAEDAPPAYAPPTLPPPPPKTRSPAYAPPTLPPPPAEVEEHAYQARGTA